MKATLVIVEQLHADGVVGSYAVGGAVGAAFYLEPVATLDVDIFVLFEPAPLILTLTPIYEACAKLGYQGSRAVGHVRRSRNRQHGSTARHPRHSLAA